MACTISGHYECLLIDANGVVTQRVTGENLVVDVGRDLILTQLSGGTSTPALYMALGSSTTAAAGSQTTLVAEAAGGVRKTTSPTLVPHGQMLFTGVWAASDNANTTVNEVGIFTASSGGTMLSRFVLPSTINKDQFSQLQINYTLQVNAT